MSLVVVVWWWRLSWRGDRGGEVTAVAVGERCWLWWVLVFGVDGGSGCVVVVGSGGLLHLAGSQPMLKSSYKAEAGVIISIPPLVGGVADVVVEIKDT
nr:hypothetical protein [Tanacetum cinerariifolium]